MGASSPVRGSDGLLTVVGTPGPQVGSIARKRHRAELRLPPIISALPLLPHFRNGSPTVRESLRRSVGWFDQMRFLPQLRVREQPRPRCVTVRGRPPPNPPARPRSRAAIDLSRKALAGTNSRAVIAFCANAIRRAQCDSAIPGRRSAGHAHLALPLRTSPSARRRTSSDGDARELIVDAPCRSSPRRAKIAEARGHSASAGQICRMHEEIPEGRRGCRIATLGRTQASGVASSSGRAASRPRDACGIRAPISA